MKTQDKTTLRKWADDDPEGACVVRAPLGELAGQMGFPLVILGLKDKIVTGRIKRGDHFNAHGLEGAFELMCTLAQAWVLTKNSAVCRWEVTRKEVLPEK